MRIGYAVQSMESAKDILAHSPKLKKQLKAAAPLTSQQEKFLEAVATIRMAPDEADAAYMARELVQCTLPHRNPGNVPVWVRRNGNLILTIKPGSRRGKLLGYPYGSIPRLLLFWITAEAVRTKVRRLELGDNLSAFMRELGLVPSSTRAGKLSDVRRLSTSQRA